MMLPLPQCFLKTLAQRADARSVADANLFPDEAGFSPRPAWQVIEAARRRQIFGPAVAEVPLTRVSGAIIAVVEQLRQNPKLLWKRHTVFCAAVGVWPKAAH